MKDYLTWLLPSVFYHTDPYFKWHKEERENEFESYVLKGSSKDISVTSSGWKANNHSAVMRYARFQSSVMDIATLLIMPTANPNEFPIFIVECVIIMDKVHVLVIDVENTEGLTKSIKNTSIPTTFTAYNKLFTKTILEKSDWFTSVASPYVIHCETHVDQLHLIENATLNCLKEVSKNYYQHISPSSYNDHPSIKAYKEHHIQFAPARKIVAEEDLVWLEEFLTHHHFKIL